MPSLEDKLAKLQLRVLQTADNDSLTAGQRAELALRPDAAIVEGQLTPRRQQSVSGGRRTCCKSPSYPAEEEPAGSSSGVSLGGSCGSAVRKQCMIARGTSCESSVLQPLLVEDAVSIEAALEVIGHGRLHRRLFLAVFACQTVAFGEPILLASLTAPGTWCAMPWAGQAVGPGLGLAPVSGHAAALALSLAGSLFGGVGLGRFADRAGRRTVLLTSLAVFGASLAATATAPNLPALLAACFASSASSTAAAAASSTLYAEWLPSLHRTGRIHRTAAVMPAASLLQRLLAASLLSNGPAGWRWLPGASAALPLLLLAPVLLLRLPESPRGLLLRGKIARAHAALRHAADINGGERASQLEAILGQKALMPQGMPASISAGGGAAQLAPLPLRRAALVMLLLGATAASLRGAALGVYLRPTHDAAACEGVAPDETPPIVPAAMALLIAAIEVPVAFAVAPMLSRVERPRALLALAVALGLACLVPLARTLHAGVLATRTFALCALQVVWTSTTELLPTQLRATGLGALHVAVLTIGGSYGGGAVIGARLAHWLRLGACGLAAAAAVGLRRGTFTIRDSNDLAVLPTKERDSTMEV
jgi:MFS family permease